MCRPMCNVKPTCSYGSAFNGNTMVCGKPNYGGGYGYNSGYGQGPYGGGYGYGSGYGYGNYGGAMQSQMMMSSPAMAKEAAESPSSSSDSDADGSTASVSS